MDAIYARQSKFKEESISIDTQIKFCQNISNGKWEVYKDEGISGKDITHRPEFCRMMNDIKHGKIERVIVYKLDRFSRSVLDFASTWDYLAKHKVEFVSVTEKFDTATPIGKAMLFVLATFAQMEREQISLRVTDNYYERVKLGRWPGGPAPYGYKNSSFLSKEGFRISSLEPDDTAEILRRIFDMYSNPTISLGDIRRELNKEGIIGPAGKPWCALAISRIIRNPASVKVDASIYAYFKNLNVKVVTPIEAFLGEYGGMIVGKRGAQTRKRNKLNEATFSLGNWKRVIPATLWLTCQKKLEENHQISKAGAGKHSWVSGLIKCGYCGRALILRTWYLKSGEKSYCLRCSGKDADICSVNVVLKIWDIEAVVRTEIEQILSTHSGTMIQIEEGHAELQIQLVKIEEETHNLINAMRLKGASEVTIKYINEDLERLSLQRAEILESIEKRQVTQLPEKD